MRKLPIIYSLVTRIQCAPYRCELSAKSCARRHTQASLPLTLIQLRKGLHLRLPDLRACQNCEIGAYAKKRVAALEEQELSEGELAKEAEPTKEAVKAKKPTRRYIRGMKPHFEK